MVVLLEKIFYPELHMFYEFSAAVMAHLRTKELNQIWEFGVFVFVFSFLKI